MGSFTKCSGLAACTAAQFVEPIPSEKLSLPEGSILPSQPEYDSERELESAWFFSKHLLARRRSPHTFLILAHKGVHASTEYNMQ